MMGGDPGRGPLSSNFSASTIGPTGGGFNEDSGWKSRSAQVQQFGQLRPPPFEPRQSWQERSAASSTRASSNNGDAGSNAGGFHNSNDGIKSNSSNDGFGNSNSGFNSNGGGGLNNANNTNSGNSSFNINGTSAPATVQPSVGNEETGGW